MNEELRETLTTALAVAFQAKLEGMGEDAKGISWFSSLPWNAAQGVE